jgi:hypothetical protein
MKPKKAVLFVQKTLIGSCLTLSALAWGTVFADTYEVSVTNLTKGQVFTPRLAITHVGGKLFTPGAPAIEQLISIAESGDIEPLMTLLESFPQEVTDMAVGEGLLMPGESQTITIDVDPGDLFSLVNMLIPTNDGFVALNGVSLPATGSETYRSAVYDAGSEANDEICSNIPGPVCGGVGGSPEDEGEGYVYIHPGIHGIGDLDASEYDWRNPAAMVVIQKM